MHLQGRLHGIAKSRYGLAAVGTSRIPPAVSGVDLLFCVQKESHKGQVIVELEQVQVHPVDAGQPHADKLVGEVFDPFQTGHLPVEFLAIRSEDAAENDHERLAALARPCLCFLEV